jgi:hypothetical protein
MRGRKLRLADVLVGLLVVGILIFVISGPLTDNPPPTHAEYVVKADKVCTDIEGKQAALDAKIFKGIPYTKTPPDYLWSRYAAAIIPTFDEELARLRKLKPPTGDKAKLEAYFKAVERNKAVWQKVAATPKNAKLLDTNRDWQVADDIGRKYGLKACAHAED